MKKIFSIFQNGGFFSIAYFFSGKTAFLKIFADFETRFQKLFFSSESSLENYANKSKKLFCSSSGSVNIREKHIFQKQVDVYFCY